MNIEEILQQYLPELITALLVIFFSIFGKPKTAEKIAKAKEKKVAKLEKKVAKDIEKAKADSAILEQLKGENEKNA